VASAGRRKVNIRAIPSIDSITVTASIAFCQHRVFVILGVEQHGAQ
jgi:hypothetical protein